MINTIRNEKGIALVSTLLLLVLGLGIVAIMFRLSTQSSKLAGLEQGYTASLDAAKSGADLFIYLVQNGNANPPSSGAPSPPFGTSYQNGKCLNVKMYNSTSTWSSNANWTGCPSATDATSTSPAVGPDVTLSLANGPIPYTVNVKLIDTYMSAGTLSQPCYNGCYYYTVISQAQAQGSNEYAEVFFVYRYPQ